MLKRFSGSPRVLVCLCCVLLFVFFSRDAHAQSDTAILFGRVLDPSGVNIQNAQLELVDVDHERSVTTRTDSAGFYTFATVKPGHYRIQVSAAGFRTVNLTSLTVNIQDNLEENFKLAVGSVAESVTVEAKGSTVDVSSSVSTIVDQQFVKELPLNGRSFQTLFQLTPGTVIASTSYAEQGQFSVNGQRTNANYFQVDGVSANVGAAAGNSPGQSVGGSLPALTAAGGTNGLVSVDALQEFVIQTSGYAPEYGRTPGAQIAITTRSGTNEWHGDLFEYVRNDLFDANDWFANNLGLKRAELRQNDFGGVLGGPILKNRTFFFLSYEGLRLRQPTTGISDVPSLTARQSASPTLQPFLNAFPLPTGPDEGNDLAPADYAFSNPSLLDAVSLRLDHHFHQKVAAFVRYNFSSSYFKQRSAGAEALSIIEDVPVRLHTGTAGLTISATPAIVNDLRLNWSWSTASSLFTGDNLGGAVPLSPSSLLPAGQNAATSTFGYAIESGNLTDIQYGQNAWNRQKQFNLVDNLSWQKGTHLLKFGADYRRLTPQENSSYYHQFSIFNSVTDFLNASPALAIVGNFAGPVNITYDNYSAYAQDTWRAGSALTVTYGLRWDFNPAPFGHGTGGLIPLTVVGLNNLATVSTAAPGTPLYHATRDNIAPRLGFSYALKGPWGSPAAVRAGFGVFYDLGNGPTGNAFNHSPFSQLDFRSPQTFPLTPSDAAPPPVTSAPPYSFIVAFPGTLRQPYTYQWNASYEQSLGANQTLNVGYIGSAAHSLLRTDVLQGPQLNPNFGQIYYINNLGYSNYNALQLQFRRRQSAGLEILASYTYAHSLDNVSKDSTQSVPATQVNPTLDYGDSDFDIRHTGSVALDYEPQYRRGPEWAKKILGGWGFNTLVIARSSPPVNVQLLEDAGFGFNFYRPDVVPGAPFFISNPAAGGGRTINAAAFSVPASGVQGDLRRNSLRGFPLFQQDFSLRRNFHLTERMRLQARVEAFNVFNHPNFASPNSLLGIVIGGNIIPLSTSFGQSQSMFGTGVSSGGLASGFNPLYQVGGPRSLQLALKLEF
jgi:hypothetical protein